MTEGIIDCVHISSGVLQPEKTFERISGLFNTHGYNAELSQTV
jgi:hypothetical protein